MSDLNQIARSLFTRRWPLDYDSIRSVVPTGIAGWYAIWIQLPGYRQPECAYVGVSDSGIASGVRERLLAHLNESHNDDLDDLIERYRYYMTFGVEQANIGENVWDIEDDLIGLLRPTTNIQLND